MFSTQKPLDNPINWSFRVGRLFGIQIRIHIAFVLCAVILIWMQIPRLSMVNSVEMFYLDPGLQLHPVCGYPVPGTDSKPQYARFSASR